MKLKDWLANQLVAWIQKIAPFQQVRRPTPKILTQPPGTNLKAGPTKFSNAAIYYCCFRQSSSGGEVVNEEHVHALREAGFRAYLLQIGQYSEIQRFESASPITAFTTSMQLTSHDIVVIPEPWVNQIGDLIGDDVGRVIHCQNPFYIFHGFRKISDIKEMGFDNIINCSDYSTRCLKDWGCDSFLHTVRPAIPEYFFREQPKKLQIAYMPRKRGIESIFIKGLFNSLFPEHSEIPWVSIDGTTRLECAKIMGESAIFASFSHLEGLGLPPIEAMAAGCIVAGYLGGGGKEYANPQNGLWVEEGDQIGFSKSLAKAIEIYKTPLLHKEFQQAGREATTPYRLDVFNESVISTWNKILGGRRSEFLLDTD